MIENSIYVSTDTEVRSIYVKPLNIFWFLPVILELPR